MQNANDGDFAFRHNLLIFKDYLIPLGLARSLL